MRSALFLNRWRVETTRSCMFAQQGRYNLAWISSFKSDCREVLPGVRWGGFHWISKGQDVR